jgi:hypothetical protein
MQGNNNAGAKHKCNPNVMDVDTIQVNQMTVEDKTHCIKEGRCFWCQNTGHRSKECLTWKASNVMTQFIAQTQCTTVHNSQIVNNHDTEADNAKMVISDTTTFFKADTIRGLKALKEEDWLKLIDKLFAPETQDF